MTTQMAPGVQIAGVSVWTDSHLQDLDAFVFTARSFLDFSNVGFDDGLKSILEMNRCSALVSTWTGKMPLRIGSFDHLVGAGELSRGISSLIAFAVLRLMARNVVGWLDRSCPGFRPLRASIEANHARTIGRSPNSRESGRNSTNTSTGR